MNNLSKGTQVKIMQIKFFFPYGYETSKKISHFVNKYKKSLQHETMIKDITIDKSNVYRKNIFIYDGDYCIDVVDVVLEYYVNEDENNKLNQLLLEQICDEITIKSKKLLPLVAEDKNLRVDISELISAISIVLEQDGQYIKKSDFQNINDYTGKKVKKTILEGDFFVNDEALEEFLEYVKTIRSDFHIFKDMKPLIENNQCRLSDATKISYIFSEFFFNRERLKNSKFLGFIDDVYYFSNLKIVHKKTEFGFTSNGPLLVMEDEEGNKVVTFKQVSSFEELEVGDIISFPAMVLDHRVFRCEKVTHVDFGKIAKIEMISRFHKN